MKWMTLAGLVAAMISGCATPLTYEQQLVEAKKNTNDELCLVTLIKPEYKKAAENELAERKAICDWAKVQLLMQARQMQAQQQAAQSQQIMNTLGTMYMLNSLSQPRPVTPAPSFPSRTNCNTYGSQTNCTTW